MCPSVQVYAIGYCQIYLFVDLFYFLGDPFSQRWKSGRFHEFNSQKIFLKIKFDRKYLGKHHGIGSFVNQNSSVMVNSN